MPDNLVITYKLLPTTDRMSYETWVARSDAPYVSARPTVLAYTCQRVDVDSTEGPPPFDYIETLQVTSLTDDRALLRSDHAQLLTQQWLSMVTGPVVLCTSLVASYFKKGDI
jgi:hypothetical protein